MAIPRPTFDLKNPEGKAGKTELKALEQHKPMDDITKAMPTFWLQCMDGFVHKDVAHKKRLFIHTEATEVALSKNECLNYVCVVQHAA